MNGYIFRWKRRFFWRKRRVVGHKFEPDQDKMVLYFADGGLEEIVRWRSCTGKLGTDWVLTVKAQMEREAGASIPINRDIK